MRGRALRALASPDAVAWVPETFFVEVGFVLRRWDLYAIRTPDRIDEAIRQLAAWPVRVAQVRSLSPTHGGSAKNLTFADATYVALAEHLNAELLTDDRGLANAPTLAVSVLRLRIIP